MKPAFFNFLFSAMLLLACTIGSAPVAAQGKKAIKEAKKQQLQQLNKALMADKEKQAALLSFYEESFVAAPEINDTVALYLADLDAVIDISSKQRIPFQIRLMDDCRVLLRDDLRELTLNGVRSGFSFKQIAATNDAYLKDVFTQYIRNYRSPWQYGPDWRYGKRVPEFGRADYLKAIRSIFTTIVTLRVRSLLEEVHVVVYAMRNNQFVVTSSGKTEFIEPLESGNYLVELSKPGFRRKVKKIVLGKYPKTIIINEALVME